MGQTAIVQPKYNTLKKKLGAVADFVTPALGIAGPIAGAVINRNTAGSATNTLTDGANTAAAGIKTAQQQAEETLRKGQTEAAAAYSGGGSQVAGYQAPYMKLGEQNAGQLTTGTAPDGDLMKRFGMSDFEADPGYQFRLAEGEKAIKRNASGMGTLVSGATLKALTGYGQNLASEEYGNAYGRFTKDQTDRFNRLKGTTDLGQSSATTAGAAGQSAANSTGDLAANTATNIANTQTNAANNIAELETQRANAQAAGDIEKANSITGAIDAITKTAGDLSWLNLLKSAVKPAAAIGSTAVGAAGAIGSIPGATLGSVPLATLSGIPGVGITGTSAAAMAPGAAPAGAGGGSAVMGLLTNPITAVVAAGVIGTIAWMKSQARHEANTWVKGFQNQFDSKVDGVNQQFSQLAQSGQLDQASAQQIRNSTAEMLAEYENQRQKFAQGGKDERRVAGQALETFNQQYGENGSKLLGWMDSWIANLAG